ncbi:glycosyltransferase family 8 protein [Rhizoctonia solani]|uniref:Glycosyltransferase family 8 protein n=1 Tax=Rhizoctonia solani TaxID=456999 RepID=A0A8H8NTP6_9AGAM|nr:glycosyltransferase family 8 protein [Rhizoctonia solani]QRW19345.1 glycosyltransferase family 8 protein [Rhizoctonia solani]
MGIILHEVDCLVSQDGGYTGADARFVDSRGKLRRLVLIDSDMLVRKNMDDLFDVPLEEGWIAAAHACTCNPMHITHYPSYWRALDTNVLMTFTNTGVRPDALCTAFQPLPESGITLHSINSGIVVLNPTEKLNDEIIDGLHNDPNVTRYGFPDQDFLSSHFKNRVKFLGYEYNALKPMLKCHSAIWRDENIRNVHYIFKDKPWVLPEDTEKLDEQFHVIHGWWWDEWRRLEAEKKEEQWWELVVDLTSLGSKGMPS